MRAHVIVTIRPPVWRAPGEIAAARVTRQSCAANARNRKHTVLFRRPTPLGWNARTFRDLVRQTGSPATSAEGGGGRDKNRKTKCAYSSHVGAEPLNVSRTVESAARVAHDRSGWEKSDQRNGSTVYRPAGTCAILTGYPLRFRCDVADPDTPYISIIPIRAFFQRFPSGWRLAKYVLESRGRTVRGGNTPSVWLSHFVRVAHINYANSKCCVVNPVVPRVHFTALLISII